MTRRLAIGLILAVLVAFSAPPGAASGQSQPNIISIYLDDAGIDVLAPDVIRRHFPNLARLLDEGSTFSNFYLTTPLCAPSRAALFRGQYAHNTKVLTNVPGIVESEDGLPTGGFNSFFDRGYVSDEIGSRMNDAGYTTMMIGKYHHINFPEASGDDMFVPPGWDEFHATLGGSYYQYTRISNGVALPRSPEYPDQYRTDVERSTARRLLRNHDQSGDGPFFLYLAPYAPHRESRASPNPMWAPRYEQRFNDERLPRDPDFGVLGTNPPPDLAELPVWNTWQLDYEYQNRLRAMAAVDDMVADLFEFLEATDRVDDTFIFLATDNGYTLGHKHMVGKMLPYHRSSSAPMTVWGPGVGIPAGVDYPHLVTQLDLHPTWLTVAGADVPSSVDGRSLLRVARGRGPDPDRWRSSVVIENWSPINRFGYQGNAVYSALRSPTTLYVEWASGFREFYDRRTDPFEIDNRYDTLTPSEQERLAAELADAEACAGPECG